MNYVIRRIDDMEAVYGGGFKRARGELGIEAFGIQVLDLPANFSDYPEHDHADDGQEEVYLVLKGTVEAEIEGERHPLDPESMLMVAPGVKRKLWTGDRGARVLVVGGVRGEPYKAGEVTKLGAPDPLAAAGR